MRFFLKSRRFKILCIVVAILIILSLLVRLFGSGVSPISSILGACAQPFKSLASTVTEKIDEFNDKYYNGEQILEENQKLQKRVDELSSQAVDYNAVKKENKFLKSFLELKEDNKDFKFLKTKLISRDNEDNSYAFTINKGSVNGVSKYDPIISSSGLVGYVSEVAPTFSKVTTILSDDIKIGSSDYRTEDSGIVSGSQSLSKKNECLFYNIPRNCSVAINDIVVTSGGGIFPEGLIIGTISGISSEDNQTSISATLKCAVDIKKETNFMIITDFDGQGSLSDSAK